MHSLSSKRTFQHRFLQKLFHPVDNSPLVIFRVCFGFLLLYHCLSFILSGKVYENFIQPPFTFTYIGFEFLQPLPGNGMYIYFGVMAVLALLVMLGAWYRPAMIGFTLLWVIIYLMQKSNYNNHYYFILLLCCLMSAMPANACFSIDAKRSIITPTHTCPQWVSWLLIAQMAIIYFYSAINKFTPDWLSGKFIALQFSGFSTRHLLGPLYGSRLFQLFICYGSIIFELLIIPLLLWKKTRTPALFVYCGCHLFNAYTFRIGIFPWLCIAAALFFLDGEKLRGSFFKNSRPQISGDAVIIRKITARRIFVYCLGIYLLFQVLLPMRSWFYPGNVFWTEEGYRMSWKMMLRKKAGKIHFKVSDTATGKIWDIDPAERFTRSHLNWLAVCPDIVWQYAQRLKKEFNGKGYPNVAVYAIDSVSLNNNPLQLLIDPAVDLTKVSWQPFSHSDWILSGGY